MKSRFSLCMAIAISVWAAGSSLFAAAKPYSIPQVENITIDGNPADWGNNGFRVDIMAPPVTANAAMPKPADLDGRFRLGWNEKGLLLLVTVRDDKADEVDASQGYNADSIELFIADKVGAKEGIQFIVTPGCDPKHPDLAIFTNDLRSPRAKEKFVATITAARSKQQGGYVIEALIPWQNLDMTPKKGKELGFQIYINDRDNGGGRKRLVWFPQEDTHTDSNRMYALKLSNKADPAITATASAKYEHFRRTSVRVIAAPEMVHRVVEAHLDGASVQTILTMEDDRAQAVLPLPLPQKDKSVQIWVYGTSLPDYVLPDMTTDRLRQFAEQNMAAEWCVFDGPDFPKFDFVHPNLVEDLIGPYSLRYQFFDTQMNEVTTAAKPGRYAAVITVIPQKGIATKRYLTIFRTASNGRWWFDRSPASITLPPQWGLAPEKVAAYPQAMGDAVRESVFDHAGVSSVSAMWLAGLTECDPKAVETTYNGPFQKDRQYWVKLKRKLDGNDQRFTREVLPPQAISGQPAVVLHDGSVSDAGVKDDTRTELDTLFKEWAEKSGEPFNVCIVRHGVVIIDAAYGMRDGKPMTTETKSWVASISKAISGTAMMTLVDQDLVSLKDDVSKYLPVFAGTSYKPSIRNLYTHTAGLWSHRGDFDQDLDQRMAGIADVLKVGKKHEYNGMSLALGSRVLEAVSGKPLPQFYDEQLFTPLGMKNTDSVSASYLTFTTAHDLAILGQMLLNKGSYGDKKYLKPETVAAMLPRKINDLIPGSEIEWGIGLTWMNPEKTIFGHGSASSSTFWVDPSRDMVITMTRNGAGSGFAEYQKRMTDLIAAQIK